MRILITTLICALQITLSARTILALPDSTPNNFLVHITAYNERRPIKEFTNLKDLTEKEDNKNIWHYYLGKSFSTLESAEVAKRDLISLGYPYAYVIDVERVRKECKIICNTDPSIDASATFSMKKVRSVHHLLFDFNRFALSNESKNMLQVLNRVLTENPYYLVEFKGHADGIGTPESNQEISEKRSESAAKFLVSLGTNANRISVSSFGMEQPIAKNALNGKDCPRGRYYNRRVEIFIKDKQGNVLNAIVEPFDIPSELAFKSATP